MSDLNEAGGQSIRFEIEFPHSGLILAEENGTKFRVSKVAEGLSADGGGQLRYYVSARGRKIRKDGRDHARHDGAVFYSTVGYGPRPSDIPAVIEDYLIGEHRLRGLL